MTTPTQTTIRLGAQLNKHLVSRGMPRDVMRNRPFVLNDYTSTFTSEVDGMKPKRVTKLSQLEHWNNLLEKPFATPYLYIISSSPNDGKAKQAAAYFMEQASRKQLAGKFPRSTRGRQTPLWHMITGSFQDRLRDGVSHDQPSMLIISNVTVNSSNVKLEKLRDLLEQFNHIPRVVVYTGEDPVTFANTKLFLPVNHVLNIATARKVSL